jgi:lysophospholipase L1-like esterase
MASHKAVADLYRYVGFFEDGGRRYPALAREYASDGKHLNALGVRWAAAHLLETLATVVE